MALTTNQVSDIVQKAAGRPATDYEVGIYSNSPIQELAGLKNYYSGLNKDTSIVDYLKYTGQNPSIENRRTLAQQYNIPNYDPTVGESNVALLRALQTGAPAAKTESAPVSGSVSNAAGASSQPTDQNSQPAPAPAPAPTPTPTPTPTDTSAPSGTPQPPKIPGIDEALAQYQNAQQAVTDIDAAINATLDNKRKEIIASGGVVDESQLKSIVYAENQPLLNQRKTLVAEQSNAGKNYQNLLAAQRESDANYYKSIAATQKDTAQAEKAAIDQAKLDQGQQKIDTAQYKLEKQAIYDDNGTKIGEKIVRVNLNNPSDATTIGVGSSSVVSSSGSSVSKSQAVSNFSTNSEAPTSENGNYVDPATGLTLNAIYQNALTYATTGKMPSMGLSSKPKTQAARNAVQNKAAAMASAMGVDLPTLQQMYKANGKAVSDAVGRLARIETVSKTLSSQFPRIAELADKVKAEGVNVTEAMVQAGSAKTLRDTGSQDAANLVELIQTVRSDYAAMQAAVAGSRGGQFFASNAEDAIPLGLTSDQYRGIQQTIEQSSALAQQATQDVVGSLSDTQLQGTAPTVSRGSMSANEFVDKALTAQGYTWDDLMSQMKGKAPDDTHTIPALDNSTGQPVFASQAEIDSGNYTPL